MTLGEYINKVNVAIADLTDGVISLSDLADFADGEAALDEMHAEELPPRDAARRIMFANGAEDALLCWSTECDECEFEDECPHIG